VSLSRVAGRNLVFSSTRQKVYELNDTAAEVWRSLHDGRAPRSIVERLVKEGHAPASADGYVSSMLAEWNRLGIRPPLQKLVRSCANERLRQSIDLTGLRICLRFRMPQAQASSQIFEHLAVDGQSHDVTFDIVNRGRECHLYRNRQWIDACSCEGLAPVLKGRLMTEVLQGDTHVLALHAATLAFRRRLLLLCGRPGAGKSTLTLALAHAGFGFASDDLALLHTDGKVSGVPFAAAVKPGSWPLVAKLWPRLLHAPVFVRGDGKRVRYVVPHAIDSPGAKPVGWVVLLCRERNADATLAPIDFSEALEGLLAGAYADRERLTTAGFAALITAVARARCFRLVYADLNDAVRTLQRACQ
jgi:hypothetical protein